jgi:hypothetical protein
MSFPRKRETIWVPAFAGTTTLQVVAMSATLNRGQIGESRSNLRAFAAGSITLLPVFSNQILIRNLA